MQERELEALRKRLSPELRQWLKHRGIAEADQDDLLQETFLALWWCEDVAKPEAFVRATLSNRLRQHWRRQYRRGEVPLESLACEPEVGPAQPRSDLHQDLERVVSRLPPRQQTIARLKLERGMSCGEIARLMKDSSKAVANVWWRTVRKLKCQLLGERRKSEPQVAEMPSGSKTASVASPVVTARDHRLARG